MVQAASLDKEHDVNLVVDIRLPEWVLVEKLLGRRVCNNCGAGYNVADIRKGAKQQCRPSPALPV